MTANDLLDMGVDEDVIAVVELVSCDHPDKKYNPDGSKKPYTQRVQEIIDSRDVDAMLVKLADNFHNDHPSRRLDYTHVKYVKTIPMLVEALGLPREDFAEYFPEVPMALVA